MGVDRLAAALAAHSRSGAAVVLDLGTAITVDWVDAAGVFQGGAIVPGRGLAAAALAHGTHLLPEVAPGRVDEPLHLPGRDTEQAIRHGLDVGMVALVEGLVADLLLEAGPGPALWLTGGDAEWFLHRTRLEVRHDPLLVVHGLLVALERMDAVG